VRLSMTPQLPLSHIHLFLAGGDNDGWLLLAISWVAAAAASGLDGLDNLH
jgi:hypothetical protein